MRNRLFEVVNAVTRSTICAGGVVGVVLLGASSAIGQAQDTRARWNTPQAPFRIYGNTYYVGPRGLASILVTSDAGHVLIDGALPESASIIADNVRRLGFRIEDVKLIVNSHVHYDHAGAIGALQRLSGARVAARRASARVLESGQSGPDDPQYGELPAIQRANDVQIVSDGDTVRVGSLELQAHATGGHTPGGTSWTWTSCEQKRCLQIVYADSVSAIGAGGFRFTGNKNYPQALNDFEEAFTFLAGASCDILLTPHPEASDLWGRVAKRDGGDAGGLVDKGACRRYAERGREGLRTRLESERAR